MRKLVWYGYSIYPVGDPMGGLNLPQIHVNLWPTKEARDAACPPGRRGDRVKIVVETTDHMVPDREPEGPMIP